MSGGVSHYGYQHHYEYQCCSVHVSMSHFSVSVSECPHECQSV